MKLRSNPILYAVLAACFHLVVTMADSWAADPFPAIALPVYQGGYDIEYSFNRLKGTKALVYLIQTNYPAAEVLEFYDAALNGRGWKPSFEICQRHWESPGVGSVKKELQSRQLFTSWEHPQYKLQLSLRLKYRPSRTNGRDLVMVQCRLQPQLDNSRYDEFMGRLKASGQYRAFAQKLDAYRKTDGEVDPALIDRDIRDKKAGPNIVAYKRILDATNQEIEDIIHRTNEGRGG